MDYDFNNLRDMLASGVTAEDIAKVFTKNLNDAIDEMNKLTEFEVACDELAEAWANVLNKCEKQFNYNIKDELYVTGEELNKSIPTFVKIYNTILSYTNKAIPVQNDKGAEQSMNFDTLVNEFLKGM